MNKKKLFEGLMLYLKLRYKNEPITVDYQMINTQIDDRDFGSYVIPQNFMDFIDTIIYDNVDEISNESYSEVSDWYRLYLEINQVEGYIKFTSECYEYDESPDQYHDNTNDEEREVLNDLGVTSVTVKYDGYGDSGDIEEVGLDQNAEEIDISTDLLNAFYDRLESAYGGWENNEGAYGTITIDTNDVSIDHIWKDEVLQETPLDLVITKDDL